jgi:threonine/homoserine/homoserine lactone efflux protein
MPQKRTRFADYFGCEDMGARATNRVLASLAQKRDNTAHLAPPRKAANGFPKEIGKGDGLITFLVKATAISLSGVMAPGPLTAATLAAGTHRRHAGAMVALGHAVVELPLVLIIMRVVWAEEFLRSQSVQITIGLTGGAFLLLMGIQLLAAVRAAEDETETVKERHPFVTGVVLTLANPYFLVWWATVGLALTAQAERLGVLAFALFAMIHWLCDLVWLEALSLASNKGTGVLGGRLRKIVLAICAVMLIGIGCDFICRACIGLF